MIEIDERNIFELIRASEQLSNEMVFRWTKSFPQNLGISPILVLHELKEQGPQKQTELANKLGYTPGAMTNISNRLIKAGYASRLNDEKDRRIVRLALTESGVAFLKKAQQKGTELRKSIFENLEDEEVKQYLQIHQKLLKNLRAEN